MTETVINIQKKTNPKLTKGSKICIKYSFEEMFMIWSILPRQLCANAMTQLCFVIEPLFEKWGIWRMYFDSTQKYHCTYFSFLFRTMSTVFLTENRIQET